MKIDQFIREYNTVPDKAAYVRKHIRDRYLPFELKRTVCKNILDACMYREIKIGNGIKRRIFSMDSPSRYFLFILTVVQYYTDIELDTDIAAPKPEERLRAFNELEKNGVTPVLVEAIGEDYKALQTVLNMETDDIIRKEESFVQYIDGKADLLRIFANSLEEALKEHPEFLERFQKQKEETELG